MTQTQTSRVSAHCDAKLAVTRFRGWAAWPRGPGGAVASHESAARLGAGAARGQVTGDGDRPGSSGDPSQPGSGGVWVRGCHEPEPESAAAGACRFGSSGSLKRRTSPICRTLIRAHFEFESHTDSESCSLKVKNTHTHARTHAHTHTHTLTLTHTHTYTRTHARNHTHTHTQKRGEIGT